MPGTQIVKDEYKKFKDEYKKFKDAYNEFIEYINAQPIPVNLRNIYVAIVNMTLLHVTFNKDKIALIQATRAWAQASQPWIVASSDVNATKEEKEKAFKMYIQAIQEYTKNVRSVSVVDAIFGGFLGTMGALVISTMIAAFVIEGLSGFTIISLIMGTALLLAGAFLLSQTIQEVQANRAKKEVTPMLKDIGLRFFAPEVADMIQGQKPEQPEAQNQDAAVPIN